MRTCISLRRLPQFLYLAGLASFTSLATTQAAEPLWTGGGTDDFWTTPGNWGTPAPVAGDSLFFDGVLRLTPVNDYAANTLFDGITFNAGAGSFDLTGASINLSGGITNLSSNAQTVSLGLTLVENVSINAVGSITLSGPIIGPGFGLTKQGVGSLTLSGVQFFDGPISIEQGTLTLSATATLGFANTVVLGGRDSVAGSTRATLSNSHVGGETRTLGDVNVVGGRTGIVATRSSGAGSAILAIGTLTHQAGGVIDFTITNSTVNTTTTNTNGILGAWATIGGLGTAGNWAAVNDSGNIVAYSAYTVLADPGPVIASDGTTNIQINNTSTGGIGMAAVGTTEINTLRISDTVARTITVGDGNLLRLGEHGGIWSMDATTATTHTITGGQITAGGADNAAGELLFRLSGLTDNNSGGQGSRRSVGLNIESSIVDNGSGAVTVVKEGVEMLQLSGTNSYSGGTYIIMGGLVASNSSSLGSGDVYVNRQLGTNPVFGGTLEINGSGDYANNLYLRGIGYGDASATTRGALRLAGTGTILSGQITLEEDTLFVAVGSATDITGRITGDGALTVGGNTYDLTFSNQGNDWKGDTSLTVSSTSSSGTPDVLLGASEVIPNGIGRGDVTFSVSSNNTSFRFDLNGYSEIINGLNSAGGNVSGTNFRIIFNDGAGPATFTLGDADANGVFYGRFQNGDGGLNLTKVGLGTQSLTGSNLYTGITTVNGGTLLLDRSPVGAIGTMSATSQLHLGGGTFAFQGADTLASVQTLGNLTINAGAGGIRVTPGVAGSATLTVGNTWTRNTGGTLHVDIASGGVLTSSPALTNGILGYATVEDATDIGFATVEAGNVVRYTGASALTNSSDDAATNFVAGAGTLLWNGATDPEVNSLHLDTSAGDSNVDLGGNVLGITTGGLLVTGSNDATLGNGQVGATNSEVIVHQHSTGTFTISGAVSGGTGGLTKSGPGDLVLEGISTYSGATFVNSGTLILASGASISSSSSIRVVAGAGLDVSAAGLTVGAAQTLTAHGLITGALAVQGRIQGDGDTGDVVVLSGGVVAPRSDYGIGKLTSGDVTLEGGAVFEVQVESPGIGDAGLEWSQWQMLNLDVSGGSAGNPFILSLHSVTPEWEAGNLYSWDDTVDHIWASIIVFDSLTGTYDPTLFSVDASGFADEYQGIFTVVQNGNALDLVYSAIPEPGAVLLLLVGAAGVMFRRRR